ncbi:hypothetical protein MGG_16592 [Pyricularia oryzae 70-15]|uniref:Uncharacterized protein n=2 Tax=Pyricularia oryzae TaxID=318829 RepID=G4MZW6_PYRO7|nr:uncharacterized protein MGG_16592 [Pyricularia oryzae 70-15]EHA51410.1 hypothetical protein MGG_16592 [Pyricularia oryzae 70-15]ELQ33725.1 hypothetical protein OOU_Y34scaffold00893g3 [Pyricularia oryzae Y34]
MAAGWRGPSFALSMGVGGEPSKTREQRSRVDPWLGGSEDIICKMSTTDEKGKNKKFMNLKSRGMGVRQEWNLCCSLLQMEAAYTIRFLFGPEYVPASKRAGLEKLD